jgi:hypothetical protein
MAKVTKKAWARLRLGTYGVANAGLGVAVVYNVLDGQQSAAWLLLVNAALTVAFFNVDLGDEAQVPVDDNNGL